MIEVEHLSKTFRVQKKLPGFVGSLKGIFRRETVEKRAVSDVSSTVWATDIRGVIPEPAAMPTMWAPSRSGRPVVNVPWGLITSIRSPGSSSLFAQVENRPPMSRLMPTLIRPPPSLKCCGGRQIE